MSSKKVSLANYYRNSADTIKIVRFAVLFAFVIFAVYSIGFFSKNLTEDSLKAVLNSVYRSFNDLTPSETEIKIQSDDTASFTLMNDDLAVITNTSVKRYAFSGDKMLDYEYTYSDAASVNAGEYLLVYDSAGKELVLYNAVAKLAKKQFEYEVQSAAINELGYFAVVSSEKTYRSGVIVYAPDGNGEYPEVFRWMSPDRYILSIALNSNGTELACSAVYNRNGAFVTELIIYDIATGAKKHTTELDDTMVMKLAYKDKDDGLYALADGRFLHFDNGLNLKNTGVFNRGNAKFFKEAKDVFLVAESNNLSGSSMTVNLFDYNAKLLCTLKTDEKVLDADFSHSHLFVLHKEKMAVYDYSKGTLTLKAELPLSVQYKGIRTDSTGRYILISASGAKRGTVENLASAE